MTKNTSTSGFNTAVSTATTSNSGGLKNSTQRRVERSKSPISIAFLIDATISREHTWIEAQAIQAEMIKEYASGSNNVEIGIIIHRGGRVESLGWFIDAELAHRSMQEVMCEAGRTKIESGLGECLGLNKDRNPKAIVMIGDCCEEKINDVRLSAQAIKGVNVPVHAFFEGDDPKGEEVYRMVANITEGIFTKFGPSMSLSALIRPLFVHAVKGPEAFQQLIDRHDLGAIALQRAGLPALRPSK